MSDYGLNFPFPTPLMFTAQGIENQDWTNEVLAGILVNAGFASVAVQLNPTPQMGRTHADVIERLSDAIDVLKAAGLYVIGWGEVDGDTDSDLDTLTNLDAWMPQIEGDGQRTAVLTALSGGTGNTFPKAVVTNYGGLDTVPDVTSLDAAGIDAAAVETYADSGNDDVDVQLWQGVQYGFDADKIIPIIGTFAGELPSDYAGLSSVGLRFGVYLLEGTSPEALDALTELIAAGGAEATESCRLVAVPPSTNPARTTLLPRRPGSAVVYSLYGPAGPFGLDDKTYCGWTLGFSDLTTRYANPSAVASAGIYGPYFDGSVWGWRGPGAPGASSGGSNHAAAGARNYHGQITFKTGDVFRVCYQAFEQNLDSSRPLQVLYFGDGTEVHLGTFNCPSAPGNISVTGVGFEPELVLFVGAVPYVEVAGGCNAMFGACDADLNQWAIGERSAFNSGAIGLGTILNQVRRVSRFRSGFSIAHIGQPSYLGSATTQNQLASVTSMDVDGFTLDFDEAALDASSRPHRVVYLALRGGDFKVGTLLQDDPDITVGFAPDSMLFASTNAIDESQHSWAYITFGAADACGNQCGIWGGSQSGTQGVRRFDASDAPTATGEYNQTHAIVLGAKDVTPSNPLTPATVAARAEVTLTATGADLNWDLTDSIARKIGYVAITSLDGTDPQTPQVVTEPATASCDAAILRATVTPNTETGNTVRVWFEYGTTVAYGTTIDTGEDLDGFDPIEVEYVIGGLTEGQTYHYRAYVIDVVNGTTCRTNGGDVPFTVGPCLDFVTIRDTFGVHQEATPQVASPAADDIVAIRHTFGLHAPS